MKKGVIDMPKLRPKVNIENGTISHDEMARYLMRRYTFKAFNDTHEILVYNPKTGRYQLNGDSVIKKLAEKTLTENNLSGKATKRYMEEVVGHIERRNYVVRGRFNSSQRFINLKNGRLDLRTMELYEHTDEFLSTIRVPVEFDSSADCPTINSFLGQIVSKENVPILEEIFGWCLDIRSPIQRAILFIGEGANGKSTFLRLLRQFLGGSNCVGISLQAFSANRFATARLYGKLANIYPDLPATKLIDSSFLKALTGGDAITAEDKYQKSFEFVNRSKQLFSANKPPVIEDDTMALWRRMIIIDFPYTFTGKKADQGLLQKLTTPDELSGLLNLAIEGLKRLREEGDFTYAPSWKKTMEKYAHLSDPVGIFVEEDCILDSAKEIKKPVLFKAYVDFCNRKKMAAGTKQAFGRKFKSKFSKNIDQRQNNWTGITLKKLTVRKKK